MATKEFKAQTKDLTALLRQLSEEVGESSNAAEYGKFLQKTLTAARTFDKADPTHTDYVARGLKPKKEAKKTAEEAPKKRKEEKALGEKPVKKAKKTD